MAAIVNALVTVLALGTTAFTAGLFGSIGWHIGKSVFTRPDGKGEL